MDFYPPGPPNIWLLKPSLVWLEPLTIFVQIVGCDWLRLRELCVQGQWEGRGEESWEGADSNQLGSQLLRGRGGSKQETQGE